MAIKLKDIAKTKSRLAPGHGACAGCAAPAILKQALYAAGENVVVSFATGCMEVVTTIFPHTAWRVPYIHNAFENSAATMSGVEAAYRALKRQGKIDKDIQFIAFGGDGGTYDIGFQSLSGMLERGHNILYICYDNEAYMNTGIQRSSATPLGAETMTARAGKVKAGKEQHRKDIAAIALAHGIPYVAQASPHNFRDLMSKVEKALSIKGPKFIVALSSCHVGWRFEMQDAIKMCELAVKTCFWPLYEYEYGKLKINYKPKEKLPITDWIKPQGRFKHLFEPKNEHIIEELQKEVDRKWEELLAKEETQG
ncbi:MAG: pyruvate ferredoxin oxidoreductase [Planctomycetes bacterium]|nr:pyruvate ferredoxin oxidoreductase [Planctomycetota bacterium]